MKNNNEIEIVGGYSLIIGYLGYFLIIIGIIFLLPLLSLVFFPEELKYSINFVIPSVVSVTIGYILQLKFKNKQKGNLKGTEDIVLVVFVWILTILMSSFPYLLFGNFTFTEAVFEAASGYTTTGVSVVDVENVPKMLLLYRSITLLVGGVGLVLILTSAVSDKLGMKLYMADGHSDRLIPNLIKSTRFILQIYVIYIFFGAILLTILGMSAFDALNHAIAAVSTGGFSTKNLNIAYYNSFYIELVLIILMILGATNFYIHLFYVQGKFKKAFKHVETKFMFSILLLSFIIGIFLLINSNFTFFESIRYSIFQVVSGATGTGFQNVVSQSILPFNFNFLIIILMIIGAQAGSTAGGIKNIRVIIMLKGVYYQLRAKIMDKRIIRKNFINKYGNKVNLTDDDIKHSYAFIMLYLGLFLLGAFLYTLYGTNIQDSLYESASLLGTTGLSLGVVGKGQPNFVNWVAIIQMISGRLEIIPIFLFMHKILKDSYFKNKN